MIKAIIFDFSRVLIFPRDRSYHGSLNALHAQLSKDRGYQFLNHFELDQSLLNFLKQISRQYPLYVFTTGIIQDVPGVREQLQSIFERVYTVASVGHPKKEMQAYLTIAEELGYQPEELLMVDDTQENLAAASSAGFKTIHFESNEQLIEKLPRLIVS